MGKCQRETSNPPIVPFPLSSFMFCRRQGQFGLEGGKGGKKEEEDLGGVEEAATRLIRCCRSSSAKQWKVNG